MESDSKDHKFIDLDEVIRKKNPRLAKTIPKFLINFLKKIIYQEELNKVIHDNQNSYGLSFIEGALKGFGTPIKVVGTERVPLTGRFIFASNHPLGGLDGLILIQEVGKIHPKVKFIVNDLLLNVKNFGDIFVPVNKHGRQTVEYARLIEETYRSDSQVLYFPAGLCSRKIKGVITDLPWHKSFITKAVKYQRDVIPVYFEAKNSNFFYNLANIRKSLGIKANIEMVFLVGEMFKQHKKLVTITFGDPIPYITFDSSKSPVEWTNFVRGKVYSLKKLM